MPDILRKLPKQIWRWIGPNIANFRNNRQLDVWFLALLIGCLVSILAILFREAIGLIQWGWLGERSESIIGAIKTKPWYVVLLVPAIGGLFVGLALTYLLPLKRTGGVADVMEARAIYGRDIEIKPAIYSAFTTIISLGSGASAGREGPMVHLGAACSTLFMKYFGLPIWSHKTMLACGGAAAVSASFNAPIAGVLFAHEIILGHYSKRSFVPIVIASVSGTLFSRLWFGDIAAFEIPDYQITSYWELPAFALLGLVCALVAILFQFAMVGTDYVARQIHIPLIIRPIIGGLLIGAIGIVFPEALGVGYEATDKALKNQLGLGLLFMLLFAKTAATAITLASRFGGGVFSPALYIGAMAGGAFGIIASNIFPDMASSNGLYAILGMGAVASAVLGAPFSTTMIVFELTGSYALTIALLLAVSISTGINQAIHGHSIFEWQLEIRGLFFSAGPHKYVMRSTKVSDFMTSVDEDEESQYLQPLEDGSHPTFLEPHENLETALRTFDSGGHIQLPVVDTKDKDRIIGNASQVAALAYYNRALVEVSEEEHRG